MDLLGRLQEAIAAHPGLTGRVVDDRLLIEAASGEGFTIAVERDGHGWVVALGANGFHESFTEADKVMRFVAWCWSGDARLREVWRGDTIQKATLETRKDGQWSEVSGFGVIFYPFWRTRRETITYGPRGA